MQPKRYPCLFLFVLSLSLTVPGAAQITIERADYDNLLKEGASQVIESDTLVSAYDVGAPGGGNSWDFSGATSNFTFTQTYTLPSETPFSETFPEAQHVLKGRIEDEDGAGDLFFYAQVSGDTLYTSGSAVSLDEAVAGISDAVTTNVPPRVEYAFPLNFEDGWTYSGDQTIAVVDGSTTLPFSESEITDNTTIDAYGTLTMPDGTTREVLRINTETTLVQELVPGFSLTTRTRSFILLAKDGAFLSISVEPNPLDPEGDIPSSGTLSATIEWSYGPGEPTSVFSAPSSIEGLTVEAPFPNPARADVQFRYELDQSQRLDLRIVDLQGRALRHLFTGQQAAGPHTLPFSVADLTPGLYFLQFRSERGTTTRPLRVLR